MMSQKEFDVGSIIVFSKDHWSKPGIDYTKDWAGIVVNKIIDPAGFMKELHILWKHGKVSEYPSSWWNRLDYDPFEVMSEVW